MKKKAGTILILVLSILLLTSNFVSCDESGTADTTLAEITLGMAPESLEA